LYSTGDVAADAVHLMALREEATRSHAGVLQEHRILYGFAFLDAAAGCFYVGVAEDDAGRATLGAILTQV
jgi:hypothetical protein